ncbi:MAG: TonB family protein [Candidatus Endonucleobacter sp. (ex Gigantidas childressi)]|nr:TonB family protein [Candidatus Endonucleobacter sp. (ex Gigantidas childressi)]
MSRELLFTFTLSILAHIASIVYFTQQESSTTAINTGSIQVPVNLTISTVSDLTRLPQQQIDPESLPQYLLGKSAKKPHQKPYINTGLAAKQSKSNHKEQAKNEKKTREKTLAPQYGSAVEEPIQKKTMQPQPKHTQIVHGSSKKHLTDVFSPDFMLTTSPSIVRKTQPKYPWYCKHRHIEGTAHLKIEIDETGKTISVTILKSSGFWQLDRSAITAVKQWIFKPAQQHNTCVRSTVHLPVSFQIKQISELGST